MKPMFVVALALAPMLAPLPAFAQTPDFSKCLFIEDMTKERLNCFDAIIRPEAIQVLQQSAPKSVYDCRYIREEDARLKCFNRFAAAASVPAPPKRAAPKPAAKIQ